MGAKYSKRKNQKDCDNPPQLTSPNIQYVTTKYGKQTTDQPILAPMVKVAAGDGTTQLIYRPYQDMKEATSHLPLVQNGGIEYATQLEIFC